MAELTELDKAHLEELWESEEKESYEYPEDEYGSGGDCSPRWNSEQ